MVNTLFFMFRVLPALLISLSVATATTSFRSMLTEAIQSGKIAFVANLAQLVEQVIRNDQVVGSSPTIGSTLPLKTPIL